MTGGRQPVQSVHKRCLKVLVDSIVEQNHSDNDDLAALEGDDRSRNADLPRADAPKDEHAPAVATQALVPPSDTAPPPQAPIPIGKKRGHWERIAAIAGAGALVVALATWWLPNPGKIVCGLIGNKGSGCSDVPDAYLGQWKGIRIMENVFGIMPPTVKTTEDTLTIKPGNLQSNVAETGGLGK